MNVADLKRIIRDQEKEREAVLAGERIIERNVGVERLAGYLGFPKALAILGLRRSGKTLLSWLLMRGKKYGYINFDDETLYGIEAKDLNLVIRAFYELYGNLEYFVFDEVQNVKGWELFVNRLVRTKKVIVTGSNSQLLSGELATHLTGRHLDFVLFPFSFREFCVYRNIDLDAIYAESYSTETSALMGKAIGEYVESGGIPEVYGHGRLVLKTLFGDIVAKDVMRRHNVRTGVLPSLAKYLVSNFSCEITFNKLKNIFSIKKIQTIRNYVRFFENAYLVFVIERFSYKLKEQFIAPKKIYCIDTGIIRALSFKASEDIGKLFENIVCIELFRRKSYSDSEMEIYYWKNSRHEEVDFVLKHGHTVNGLIQVCYYLADGAKERELRALVKAGRELKCANLLVITSDETGEETVEGAKVRYVPLWKWLLEVEP